MTDEGYSLAKLENHILLVKETEDHIEVLVLTLSPDKKSVHVPGGFVLGSSTLYFDHPAKEVTKS